MGLESVADRKVKKLSGGMVRRLGVAQALVHEPRVLIVDEPTVGLDPEERMRFRQLVTRLGQELLFGFGRSCYPRTSWPTWAVAVEK